MGELTSKRVAEALERVCARDDAVAYQKQVCVKNDAVTHPQHYTDGKIEVIEFIQDKHLNFSRGNAIKYICRAGKKDKGKEIEDLEKAIQYIKFEIAEIERRQEP